MRLMSSLRTFLLASSVFLPLLGLGLHANAQTCYEWVKISPPDPNFATLSGGPMVYDEARGVTVLYEGTTGYTWTFDGTDWKLASTGGIPRRVSAAMAYDSDRGVSILFGGKVGSNTVAETWEWNGSSWRRVATGGPDPRHNHVMTYDSERKQILVHGGEYRVGSTRRDLTDTWAWNGTTWTLLEPNGPANPLGMVFDPVGERAVATVGDFSEQPTTWQWDGAAWSQLNLTGTTPGTGAISYDSDAHVIYAGGPSNDCQDSTTSAPCEFPDHCAYDSQRSVHVYIDGYQVGNMVWEWDGITWRTNGRLWPVISSNKSFVDVPGRGVLVLPGSGQYPDDFGVDLHRALWFWNGVEWQILNLDVPIGYSPNVAYDSQRGVLVVFGGYAQSGYHAKTWEFDGQQWIERAVPGPSARSGFGNMTFDESRGVMVLHGGANSGFNEPQDTWEYDGSEWRLISEVGGPPTEADHRLVYDPSRQAVLMFGVEDNRDVWSWNGKRFWRHISTNAPEHMSDFALAFDTARSLLLKHGGGSCDKEDCYEYREFAGWQDRHWRSELAPFAASNHGMAYDAERDVTITGVFDTTSRIDDGAMYELVSALGVDEQPEDSDALPGEAATFSLAVHGADPIEYHWYRNDLPLEDDGRILGARSDTLTITSILPTDAGAYRCVIRNGSCGPVSSMPARLLVVGPRLRISTSCPDAGPADLGWESATPDGRVALFYARARGNTEIPPGSPCAGVTLALDSNSIRLAARYRSDARGEGVARVQMPAGACGGYIQLLDLSSCTTSNPFPLN